MTPVFFGEPWDAPIIEDATQLPEVPTYAACLRCNDMIAEDDQGFVRPYIGSNLDPRYLVGMGPDYQLTAVHRECDLASVVGHAVGVCSCTGYDESRESAREVWRRVAAGRLE